MALSDPLRDAEGLDALMPGSALLQAKMSEALDRLEGLGGAILHGGPPLELPPGLRARTVHVALPGPSSAELRTLLSRIVRDLNARQHVEVELLRKGRFDEVFFVDLPDQDARAEILRIHLVNRNRNPGDMDTGGLAALAGGFSGVELERVESLRRWAANRTVSAN